MCVLLCYRETVGEDNNNNTTTISTGSCLKARHRRGTVSGIIGGTLASALGTTTAGGLRRTSVSVKRPLDIVLPCQEIQYLDISYQKVCSKRDFEPDQLGCYCL